MKALSAFLLIGLTAAAAPKARWLQAEHDYGAFSEDLGVVHCTIQAVNDGDEPLMVISARANCGCTKPQYSRTPVAPGDTLSVTIGYDATGRPGRFEKSVYINTNDPGQESAHTVTIRGTVIGTRHTLERRYPVDRGPVALRESQMYFGEVSNHGASGQYIEGYNTTSDTLDISVVSPGHGLSALVSPDRPGPGEQFVISATVLACDTGQWDIITDTLTLNASGQRITIPWTVTVTEDFSTLSPDKRAKAPRVVIQPRTLEAPARIDTLSTAPLHWTLEITNRGKSLLTVRRLYSVDPAVAITDIPNAIKPGKTTKVKITVDPRSLAGRDMLNARLILVTDDPDNPRTIIRLVGEI